MVFASTNHKSGESVKEDLDRVSELYVTKKGCKFALFKEYEVLSIYYKWMINNVRTEEQAAR